MSSQQQYADWRQARRDVARRHHPDVGGDPEEYVRLMTEVDRRFGPSAKPAGQAQPRRLLRLLSRSRLRIKGTTRAVRSHIPRSWPGSRRYFDL